MLPETIRVDVKAIDKIPVSSLFSPIRLPNWMGEHLGDKGQVETVRE
jgi:hypothetical protein